MADTRVMLVGQFTGSSNSFVNLTLNTSTIFLAFIAQAEEAATITELGFRQGTLTGTSPTWRIGFQTRGANGEPDGTYLGGGSPQRADFTVVGGNDNTWVWITLDNARAVTRGEIVCIVIEYVSGTIDGSNNVSIARTSARTITGVWGIPYSANASGGSYTLQDDHPCWGMKTISRSYGDMVQAAATVSYDANDSPDEHGNAFTFVDGVAESFQVLGAVIVFTWADPGAGNNIIMSLYNDTTLLQEVSIEGRVGSTAGEGQRLYFDEATLSTLNPGTEYILAVRPDDTAVTMGVRQDTYSASQDLVASDFALPGFAPRHAERTDAGAWTFTTTEFIRMRLIIKDITEPAGVGAAPPNVQLTHIVAVNSY